MNTDFSNKVIALYEQYLEGRQMQTITVDDVDFAKEEAQKDCSTEDDYFCIFACLNLLNSAIKLPEWKKKLTYEFIKGNAARVFAGYILHPVDGVQAYYAIDERCVYFKVYGVVFSFHHIPCNGLIRSYVASPKNVPLKWSGIRLQKIACEVLDIIAPAQ